MTPAARSLGASWAIMLVAPRSLNEPVTCRLSHFKNSPFVSRIGVLRTTLRMRVAAARMSSSVTSPALTVCTPLLLAGPGELLVLVVSRHLASVSDRPSELREQPHVVDRPREVPIASELVGRLVIDLVVV